MSEQKSGTKTSEFWVLIGTILGILAPTIYVLADKWPWLATVLGVTIAAMSCVYTAARAYLKKEQAKEIDLISDEDEATLGDVLDKVDEVLQKLKPPSGPSVMTILLIGVLLFGCAGCMQPFVAKEAARADRGVDNWLANREAVFDALLKYQALANDRAGELLADAIKAAPDQTNMLVQKEVAARLAQAQDIAAFRARDDENAAEVKRGHARMVRASGLFGSKTDLDARLDQIERIVLKFAEGKGK